jgi:SulP family sulfate permease
VCFWQVQDAGLIFLSHIATDIAAKLTAANVPPLAVTATALVVINLGTALLGIALIALGRLKLARLVSYLPLPVIGGQIVFIAAFCFR